MHTKCSDPKSLVWSTECLKTQRFVREIQIKLKQRTFLLLISSALWLLLPKTKSSSSVWQSGQETILFLLIQGLTNGQTLLPNTLAFLSREAEEYGPLCNSTIPPAPLVKNRHHHLRPPCRQTTASRTSGPRGPCYEEWFNYLSEMECFVIVGVTAVLFGNLHWSWYGFWGLVLYKRIQKELSCLQWTVYWTVKTFEGKQQDEREKGWFIVCGLHTMHCKQ